MPDALLSLAADKTSAFSNPAELLSHHLNITMAEARAFLHRLPPSKLLRIEYDKLTDKNFLKP